MLTTALYPLISSSAAFLRARRPPPYRPSPSPVDARLGRRLRAARELLGITQKQLGAAMGVSAAMVRRYESGARPLTPARFAAAVSFLGLPLSWFFRSDA
jgi:DNA-binding XRE family transcriptional regulator